MAAASPDVILPSSGISAISMAAETGPIPGMDRRSLTFAAEGCLMRDDALDPLLEITDLRVQQGLEVCIHALDVGGDVLLPARRDLDQKPLPHVHDLRRWPEPVVGWVLMGPAEGRGIALEAAFAARRYAYDTLNLPTAISLVDPDNTRSIRLAERMDCTHKADFTHVRLGQMQVWRHPAPADLVE